jgi:uncharacterized protein (TIGR03000 family)
VVPAEGKVIEGEKKPQDQKKPQQEKKQDQKKQDQVSTSARLIVNLPADATLTVDGVATRSTSDRREFVSPALEAGKVYSYTLRAEFVREGKPVVITRAVSVEAGAEINVSLNAETAAVAAR